jgi:hypothetical protein
VKRLGAALVGVNGHHDDRRAGRALNARLSSPLGVWRRYGGGTHE